jgi:mono/diheme cytochrome c family protein
MKKISTLSLSLILASCTTSLYVPSRSFGSISSEDLKKGRQLYITNCASCHTLYLPNQYDAVTWQHNLDEMQERAKINDMEKKLIFDYLVSAPK